MPLTHRTLRLALRALTLGVGAALLRDLWRAHAVPLVLPAPPDPAQPLVDVIIPARNEAQRLPRLLAALAAQTTRRFRVTVVDDSSTDGTAAVAASFAGQLPAFTVLPGAALPPGWAGKCWACWQAAQRGDATWLLFLDADTAPAPELIASLVHAAAAGHYDFLSLLALLELGSFWERVLMPAFVGLIGAVFPLDQVNDPRSPLALANGQCILVTRSAYVASGGHGAVRASILEDVDLARLVKSQGFRMAALPGPDLLSVRMYTRFSEVSEGLRKNAWAGYAAGGWRSAWGGTRQALLAFGPPQLVAAGLVLRWRGDGRGNVLLRSGLVLWAMITSFWGLIFRRQLRLHPAWALLMPLGTAAYFALAAWAWLTLRFGRGVTWKGRSYR